MARPLRVLIVDDSMFMRAAIKKTLERHAEFIVVGQAKNGREAIAQNTALAPDVITMDYNMPDLDGVAAVREIMRTRPTPIIMFSAHTKDGAKETFDALAAGAVDFCTKPNGEISADLSAVEGELVSKLLAAATAQPRALSPILAEKPAAPSRPTLNPAGPRLVIVAVSTGGPAALSRVVPAFPANTRFALVIVQHMPALFTSALAERLNNLSAVEVKEADDGDMPRPGLVLVAPGNRHLEFADDGSVRLRDGEPLHGCRPAADITMRSAAKVYGARTRGVVMTGMGRDGTDGLRAIKHADGKTMAQDAETSVIFGMPKSAIEAGVVDEIAPLDELATRLRFL